MVLLAHPDPHLLERARRAVTLEVEELEPVLDLDEALTCGRAVGGRDNVFKDILIEKGDPDSAWARAAHVVEGEYRTGAQEQLYIETNGMAARFEPDADGPSVMVCGSSNVPTTCTPPSCSCSACPETGCGSCSWRPAAPSAARRTTPRSSPATPPCWPGRRAGR